MTTIESIIYGEIKKTAGDLLAKKDDTPAIFYGQAPDDTDSWKGQDQYPRIIYATDYKYDPERKTSGTLQIDIYTKQDEEIYSEDLAKLLRKDLDRLFVTDDQGTMSLAWNLDTQWAEAKENPKIAGTSMYFDLYDYPFQKVSDEMDPTYSASLYSKDLLKDDAKIIGIDTMDQAARGDMVYFYFSNTLGVDYSSSIYAVTWVRARIKGQFEGPNADKNIYKFVNQLALDQEICLEDGSPFFIEATEVTKQNTGSQLIIDGRYGVLRGRKDVSALSIVSLREENILRRIIHGKEDN